MADKAKILVVEDDMAIARGLVHNLEYEGYEVRLASHGNAVMGMFAEFAPDLIVLDVMLPGKSGLEILEELRASGSEVHVIILSALSSEKDKVTGLYAGADDYVSKPFSLREFLARVEAAMRRIRRAKAQSMEAVVSGDLTVSPEEKQVMRGGQVLKLTPKAFELLLFFAQHPGRIYSRDDLLHHVWHDEYDGTARTVDNFVLQIRGQIELEPSHPKRLETVHGMGYRFNG
ncbi:MAG: response regulator transcription factor [Proteobacteria bacterium]|nr:response regulator transcription factor [Pseudomonadota bacterium]MBQ4361050.1 response regulator transcription factor [Pseudomonadota bacterium]